MQQTDKYKLNKPGVDDPIAIAPLNENMDKVEAAITAETAARAGADAALDCRVLHLENYRILIGTYEGNPSMKEHRLFDLGGRPAALMISHRVILSGRTCILIGDGYISSGYKAAVWLNDNGFETFDVFNDSGTYSFIAFFGDWEQKHFPKPEV